MRLCPTVVGLLPFSMISKRTHPHFYNLMVYSECTVSVAQSGLLLDAQSSGDLYF